MVAIFPSTVCVIEHADTVERRHRPPLVLVAYVAQESEDIDLK